MLGLTKENRPDFTEAIKMALREVGMSVASLSSYEFLGVFQEVLVTI